MKERVLFNYLQNKINVAELAEDLKGSQVRNGHDSTSVIIEDIDEPGEFMVVREHLIRLCNDALAGKLTFEDLNTISFAVICSDFFTFDTDDPIVDEVLFDWDNPEIGFPLTEENMQKWKLLLESGENTFDYRQLKQKKKNKK